MATELAYILHIWENMKLLKSTRPNKKSLASCSLPERLYEGDLVQMDTEGLVGRVEEVTLCTDSGILFIDAVKLNTRVKLKSNLEPNYEPCPQ